MAYVVYVLRPIVDKDAYATGFRLFN